MNRTTLVTLATLGLLLAVPTAMTEAARKKKASPKAATETSADVRRQEEKMRREIRDTREQIRLNEQELQQKLNELNKIGEDIETGKQKVTEARRKVDDLNGQIKNLEAGINKEKKELERMRSRYLKTIKKLRVRRKQSSNLAFLFSSRNFHEASRRFRYLQQFSQWRKKKSEEIEERVGALKKQSDALSRTKTLHDHALAENVAAQENLQKQYAVQGSLVSDLKKNGQALQTHLAKKQSEANALKGRIAALIAEEQGKAEARRREEDRRKEETRRKEAEQKALAEAKAAEARAAEAKAAEAKAAKAAKAKAESEKAALARANADKGAKDKAAKDKAAKEAKAEAERLSARKAKEKETLAARQAKEKGDKDRKQAESDNRNAYAEARKRKPRTQTASPESSPAMASRTETPKAEAKKTTDASAVVQSGFAGMKGSLPRPVSGHFRILRRFGTNTVADMPGVSYDNPGIDAEVTKGSSVSAVYGGTVSGVYMIPGYSTVVIVNHDGYYTVYGNISQASVKVGDHLAQGHTVGRVADDPDNPGHGLLHFEVWKNREKQNPMTWIN